MMGRQTSIRANFSISLTSRSAFRNAISCAVSTRLWVGYWQSFGRSWRLSTARLAVLIACRDASIWIVNTRAAHAEKTSLNGHADAFAPAPQGAKSCSISAADSGEKPPAVPLVRRDADNRPTDCHLVSVSTQSRYGLVVVAEQFLRRAEFTYEHVAIGSCGSLYRPTSAFRSWGRR
jgi:hypothetical protein